MNYTTRTIKIGEKRVIITNVPDDISDEELQFYALKKMMQMQLINNSNPNIGVCS